MPITSPAMPLEIDPSIIENNMTIVQESRMDELKNIFAGTSEIPTKLVKPTPGFCVKTFSNPGNKKIFINICKTDAIPCPPEKTTDELMKILNSEDPSSYRVPMSIGEGRVEQDKSGEPATAYDVAINPTFFDIVENDELFKSFFLTVVFEGLQDKYQFEIEMQKYVILKNRKAMGTLQTHRIQIRDPIAQGIGKQAKPLIEELDQPAKKIEPYNQEPKKEIHYRLRREPPTGEIDHLVAEFRVPNAVGLEDMRLEVGEDRLALEVDTFQVVDFFLPCGVEQGEIQARLDRNTQMLSVKMPVAH